MKIGAIYPQIELKGDPASLRLLGTAAEELGYDYFAMFDHVLGAEHAGREPKLWGPYTEHDPFHDPLVSFGFLAGITRRIELVTGIMVLPQRPTALVARQAADVDLLSGGRLRLGVGVGWNPVEFEALGQDFHARGKRTNEQIAVLRKLWAGGIVRHEGQLDASIDRAALNPAPGRQIPVWIGGVTEAAWRRAARLGDGFIFGGPAAMVINAFTRVREMLVEEGRDPASFGADWQVPDGTPAEAMADLAGQWREAGGTHIAVRTMKLGYENAGQHRDHYLRAMELLRSAGF